jgi:hypothetical protein
VGALLCLLKLLAHEPLRVVAPPTNAKSRCQEISTRKTIRETITHCAKSPWLRGVCRNVELSFLVMYAKIVTELL